VEAVDPHARADAAGIRRRRRVVGRDLAALALIGVLLVGALGATAAVLYDRLYSPTAFVTGYLDLLTRGQAAQALAVPGVAIDSAELESAGLPVQAGEALLRRDALAPLSEITPISTVEGDDGVYEVTVAYHAGPHEGRSTFRVEPDGWIGVAPSWRFAQSPLAVVDLAVRGSMQFEVNGFPIDKRQVAAAGSEVDPSASVPLLVFSPGLYSIAVDTAISASPGVAVLSDAPQARIPVEIQTQPTEEFVGVVQEKVESFLSDCATQRVLQPTGCPFGFPVQNRILEEPTWSIAQQPTVELAPDGENWSIRRTQAVAHIRVDVQLIRDGSIREIDEDVPFFLTGSISILPDGTASIAVAASD
jgi:hypothetical protein